MNRGKWTFIAMAAALSLPIIAHTQEPAKTPPAQDPTRHIISPEPAKQDQPKKQVRTRLTSKQKDEALKLILSRQGDSKDLLMKATDLTINIGKLAASGKLPQDQEAMKLMKDMVETLQEIQDRLKKIDEEIEDIKGWIEGQNENLPILGSDVADLKRSKWGNYIQFQYRDTDQLNGQTDAFAFRRIRLGLTQTIDPRTSIKVSFDLAQNATGLSNNTAAQLRDAFLTYDIEPSDVAIGLQATAGQVPMPLGYELERSSSEREFPERAQYNRIMFDGERGRGISLKKGLGANAVAQLGVWNALTFNDTETRDVTGSTANRLGVTGGLRYFTNKLDMGVSGFWSSRPPRQAGYTGATQTRVFSEDIDNRHFYYADLNYVGLFLPGLFLRAEGMVGFDRVPLAINATTTGTTNSGVSSATDRRLTGKDMAGWQVMLGYNIDARNTLSFRYEQFDPDLDRQSNLFTGYGASYIYYINPNARLQVAHEVFEDAARRNIVGTADDKRYGVTTVRLQFKF
ncbi:MAG: hypothetical protein H7Y17_15970 [Chlorobia bacterium]|nr:hypothetical protein [Fimbriimonadaceae bacterium]